MAHGEAVDVAVIGGGLIGSSLALALGRGGVRTALIDRSAAQSRRTAGSDGRTTAVAHGSKLILEALGAWGRSAGSGGEILDIRVSDGPSRLHLHYDHRVLGDQPLGVIVENHILRADLDAAVADLSAVERIEPAEVATVDHAADHASVHLVDGRTIKAALVVGTDGRGSTVREAAGIRSIGWDYGQAAVVFLVRHEEPHRGVAHERFLAGGPLALLPLGDPHTSSIVWTERSALAQHLMTLDESAAAEELHARFGPWLGRFQIVSPRQLWPLSFHHAVRYVAPRLALAGDAAHGIHPIAGQGANLGWRDAAVLAEVLVDARRIGLDIGSEAVLRRYQTWRRPDNLKLAASTDVLNRLFSNDLAPARLLRDVGMAAVERIGPLKRYFMREAMGVGGALPRLARGLPI